MQVSLIGTGLMGCAMTERLLASGHAVTVWNRTREKTEPLAEMGATVADAPEAAIGAAGITILMLTDEPAIRSVLAPDGTLPDLGERVLLQMGTIGSDQSRRLLEDVTAAGGEYFEAPVLGSRGQAVAGTLLVAVGSTAEQYERWRPLLECFGPDPQRVGEVGQAASVKLAFNQLIASHITAFSLSLGMIRRRGVEVEEFMQILRRSSIYAETFDKKLPRLLERDFSNPNFRQRLLLKDIDLIRTEAEALGLDTAALVGIRRLVDKALAMGLSEDDYSTVYNAVDPPD